jgi:hypothetical protein
MLTSPSQILREGRAGHKNYSPTSVNYSLVYARELVDQQSIVYARELFDHLSVPLSCSTFNVHR